MDDALGTHPPQERLIGIVLARFASCVSAALENRRLAFDPFSPGRAKMSPVGAGADGGTPRTCGVDVGPRRSFDAQAFNEAVAEIIGKIKTPGMDDCAVALGELYMPFGIDAAGVAVINDTVGLERPALVIKPHIAFCRHGILDSVVAKLRSLDEHFGSFGLSAVLAHRLFRRGERQAWHGHP